MEYWEREKGLDREILISAVEDAMVSAAKRAVGPARELRCEIDRKDGDIRAFATLIVVETVTDKQNEISLDSAHDSSRMPSWRRNSKSRSPRKISAGSPRRMPSRH